MPIAFAPRPFHRAISFSLCFRPPHAGTLPSFPSSIHDGAEGGLIAYKAAFGRVVGCELFGHQLACVEIKTGADVAVERSSVRGGAQSGFFIQEEGRGAVSFCDVWGNKIAGVVVVKGGNPVLRGNHIHDNGRFGLIVLASARGAAAGAESANAFGANPEADVARE